MTKYTDENPPRCYLSVGTNDGRQQWTVIYQGLPLCAYKATRAAAEIAARQMKVSPAAIWNADAGKFQPMTETGIA